MRRAEKSRGYHAAYLSGFLFRGVSSFAPDPFPALLPVSLTFTIGGCSPATDATKEPSRTYRRLHTCDLDPEAHVALLLARMSRDIRAMYEPPDLSTPEAAARAVVKIDGLLATLESHHCAIKALRNHLQRYRLKPRHGIRGFDSSRT